MTGLRHFNDAYRARWTVVRLFYEGWHQQSIAGDLKLSCKHIWHLLRAFERDDLAGLVVAEALAVGAGLGSARLLDILARGQRGAQA